MKRILMCVLLLAASPCLAAQWHVEGLRRSNPPRLEKSASVYNDEGFNFSIYRDQGRVWARFSLPPDSAEELSPGRLPVLQVDDGQRYDMETLLNGYGLAMYEASPDAAAFVLWHGHFDQGLSSNLIEIMEGNSICLTYLTTGNEDKKTCFTLEGASKAIARVLHIPARIDHARESNLQRIKLLAFDKCLTGMHSNESIQCIDKVDRCRRISKGDADKFKACIDRF